MRSWGNSNLQRVLRIPLMQIACRHQELPLGKPFQLWDYDNDLWKWNCDPCLDGSQAPDRSISSRNRQLECKIHVCKGLSGARFEGFEPKSCVASQVSWWKINESPAKSMKGLKKTCSCHCNCHHLGTHLPPQPSTIHGRVPFQKVLISVHLCVLGCVYTYNIYIYLPTPPTAGGARQRRHYNQPGARHDVRASSKSQGEGSRETKTARSKSTRARWQR